MTCVCVCLCVCVCVCVGNKYNLVYREAKYMSRVYTITMTRKILASVA